MSLSPANSLCPWSCSLVVSDALATRLHSRPASAPLRLLLVSLWDHANLEVVIFNGLGDTGVHLGRVKNQIWVRKPEVRAGCDFISFRRIDFFIGSRKLVFWFEAFFCCYVFVDLCPCHDDRAGLSPVRGEKLWNWKRWCRFFNHPSVGTWRLSEGNKPSLTVTVSVLLYLSKCLSSAPMPFLIGVHSSLMEVRALRSRKRFTFIRHQSSQCLCWL